MIDGDDLELFARSLRHATEAHTGDRLDLALDELGWPDALAVDPRTAVSVAFELQGRAAVTSSALDAVLAAALGVDAPAPSVVLPPLARTHPPARPAGAGLEVLGVATARVRWSGRALVALAVEDGAGAAFVDAEALARCAVGGLDPDLGLVVVSGKEVPIAARLPLPPAAWTSAVAAGQRALGHELVGASRAMLDLAREHALERIQFGQPIARFQAVRHRLAEALVAVEAADDALAAAWDDGSPLAAAAAKAIAGRSSRIVARHAQQVLAGIGFTTEHRLHRYVRRVLVLDRLLGDARTLTRTLGQDLLRARELPPMLPL